MKKFEIAGHEPSFLPEGKEWTLAWSDEFDGDTLDESKWNYRLDFWGERFDAYTDRGVSLDGESHVVFRPVIVDGRVCSAQLQTGGNSFDRIDLYGAVANRMAKRNGDNPWNEIEIWPLRPLEKPKFMHRYGYYEARVKFQTKDFWWSAFWTQSPSIGTSYDPTFSGVESDIIEDFVNGKLTSGNIWGGYGKQIQGGGRVDYPFEADGEYHRVGLDWSEDGYVFYFDGKETSRISAPVSQVEQFILLTTEVKGYRSGNIRTDLTDEERADCFMADYVRVFDEVKPKKN